MAKAPKNEKDPQREREDEVLRRLLNTPPKPHKPKGGGSKSGGEEKKN